MKVRLAFLILFLAPCLNLPSQNWPHIGQITPGTTPSPYPPASFILTRDESPQPRDGLVSIPGGGFTMGSPANQKNRRDNEGPQHWVTIDAFYMGMNEVTQTEWLAVMGTNPSQFRGNNLPVEQVSWYEILVYCNKRSAKEGLTPCYSIKGSTAPDTWGLVPTAGDAVWDSVVCDFMASGYRLPTEAEWEYACRAGTDTATAFGDALSSNQANFDGTRPYNGAEKGPNLRKTSPVESYLKNNFGLFDMHGNVFEWCWDWYGNYSPQAQKNPTGPTSGEERIARGACWGDEGSVIQSSRRGYAGPELRDSGLGFRLARSAMTGA